MQLGRPLFARSLSVVLQLAETGLNFLATIALTASIRSYAHLNMYEYFRQTSVTLGLIMAALGWIQPLFPATLNPASLGLDQGWTFLAPEAASVFSEPTTRVQ